MSVKTILETIRGKKSKDEVPGLFFDFDGTISEIVPDPHSASILPGAKEMLRELGARDRLVAGVISGRGIDDLKSRVGVPGLVYSGNHGAELEIFGERHDVTGGSQGRELEGVESELKNLTPSFPGMVVERKRFSVSVHTRNVDDLLAGRVEGMVGETVRKFGNLNLKVKKGKQVLEVLSPFSGNKGEVMALILEKCERKWGMPVFPVYFGDDMTDRYVYDFLRREKRGISVFVIGEDRVDLEADFALGGPREVVEFMRAFVDEMNEGEGK